MELGETVCLPNGAPLCERCPVKEHCKAFLSAMVEQYPVKTEKKSRKTEKKSVFLLHNTTENTYGIRKRPKEGLLADLWEFPNATGHLTESEAASEIGTMGFIVKSIRSIGSARHIFTHVEWDMIGYEIEIEGTSPDVVFETSVKIEGDFAIPTAFRYYSDLMIK
jgi:A/G-specific adenine glycosylase